MNAISAIASELFANNVAGSYNSYQNNTSGTQESTGNNSFLSILNLLDVNADQKIDKSEMEFGAGFAINSLIYALDRNDDQLLSSQEAGVSPGLINLLDTDGDQNLSAAEMINPARKIVDGLVSALDTDGDQALSKDELGILELFFSSGTSSVSNQGSDSVDVNQAFDLDTIPDRMRQAGFQGTDNELYYVLASTYAGWPWQPDPANPNSYKLSEQRDQIYAWFDDVVNDVSQKMKANPNLKVTAIVNDGPDRCGFRLGPAIMAKLSEFGDRVQMGTIYDPTTA